MRNRFGESGRGRGNVGFSRAFLYAGAKNLVLSLWKVNDASTSNLMTSFYATILNREMGFTQSLAQAKMNLVETETYSHPYFWAPFILIGD
jgi:CHAT domain-containing protein